MKTYRCKTCQYESSSDNIPLCCPACLTTDLEETGLIDVSTHAEPGLKAGHPEPKGVFTSVTALDKQVGGTHYKGDVIQHVEYCQKNKIPWCESAAIKYIVRHRKKNGRQDIEKAIHYLELLLDIEYPKKP